jgi:hypothetical protein
VAPTGRAYTFPRADVAHREWFWRPKILNYPVQGLGADLVAIGRVTMWKRLRKLRVPVLFQSTVHDSVDLDLDSKLNPWYNICRVVENSIQDIPINFERLFNVPFDLPLNCEITYGPNLRDQQKYEPNNNPES